MTPKMCGAVLVALATVLSPVGAQTPEPAPVQPGDVLRVERTGDVRLAFFGDGHTWRGGTDAELRIGAAAPDQILLEGTGGRVVVYLKSWIQARLAADTAFDVQEHTSSLAGDPTPGQRWKVRLVAQGSPVSWCDSLTQTVTSDVEVLPPQDYAVKIDGVDTKVTTWPIVERGQWNRCASGKRYTRLLYAPALRTVMSIEHIGFRPTGQAHESSFRFDVKELRRTAR